MRVNLNERQVAYLKQHLSIHREVLSKYFVYSDEKKHVAIEVDENTADEIRDWAGERLQEVGFDIDYNLTEEGVILEELGDLLFV